MPPILGGGGGGRRARGGGGGGGGRRVDTVCESEADGLFSDRVGGKEDIAKAGFTVVIVDSAVGPLK